MPINGSLKLNRLRSLGEPSPGGIAAIVFMLIRPDLPSRTLIKKRRRRERCPFAGNIDNIVMRLREKDAEAWSCKLKSASLQEPDLALAVSSWVLGRQKAKPRAAMLGGEPLFLSGDGLGGPVGGKIPGASPHTYNKDLMCTALPGNEPESFYQAIKQPEYSNSNLSPLSPSWLGSDRG